VADVYYYVRSGAITNPPPKTIWVGGRERTVNPFSIPHFVGSVPLGAAAGEELAALGVYRLVVTERGEAPGLDYMPVIGDLVVGEGVVTRTDSWRVMTDAERTVMNKATWAEQAQARKDREAAAALAEPDSTDPNILRRKLNAALHLLNTR